jgi:hypothetical protein
MAQKAANVSFFCAAGLTALLWANDIITNAGGRLLLRSPPRKPNGSWPSPRQTTYCSQRPATRRPTLSAFVSSRRVTLNTVSFEVRPGGGG